MATLPIDTKMCFVEPERLAPSAWIQHVPFAMVAVDLLRPRVLVELGSHYGVSYCAFCQAVQELRLNTHCTAIDTWQGEDQAGFYGPEVLDDLRAHHDPRYSAFSQLLQSTFDAALPTFEDSTIDLLHIDGYHTYEAVRHDFESWLPKMTDRGVVLLHDTNDRRVDFGVWRFWDEVSAKYPSLSFYHGHGLGVAAVGSNIPGPFLQLLTADAQLRSDAQSFFYQHGAYTEARQAIYSVQSKVNYIDKVTFEAASREQQASVQLAQAQAANELLTNELSALRAEVTSLVATTSVHRQELAHATTQIEAMNTELDFFRVQYNRKSARASRSLADFVGRVLPRRKSS